jgi:hypothetical protein
MNSRSTAGWLSALLLILAFGRVVAAPVSEETQTISDITIGYRNVCPGPVSRINLGDLTINMVDDGGDRYVEASFVVDAAVSGPGSGGTHLWDCLKLHYLQLIWRNDQEPLPTYLGGTPALPVIDPPQGGWDYMYTDGAGRTMPDLGVPNYSWAIDDLPWYLNATGEEGMFEICIQYDMNDGSTPPAAGLVGFTTYLVAEAIQTCDLPDCLQPGETLLLAGFNWTAPAMGAFDVLGTFINPGAAGLVELREALAHANFGEWANGVTTEKVICCTVPEPGTLAAGLVLARLAGARRRRRSGSRPGGWAVR